MKPTVCRKCKAEISSEAKTCPHCGSPSPPEIFFARWGVPILIIILIISVFFMVIHGIDSTFSSNQAPINSSASPSRQNTSWNTHAASIIENVRVKLHDESIRERWEYVEIKADNQGFMGIVWFKDAPSYLALSSGFDASLGDGIVENDTKAIARAILHELVAQGDDPSGEHIRVMVSGQQHVKGETGKPLVVWYGYASYNEYSDSLEFKLCHKTSWTGC